MKNKLNYPILHLFENDKNIYAQKKPPQIASISQIFIFNNSIILDSKGHMFIVNKAFKIGWLYFFGFHPFIKGRTAKIDYEYKNMESLSLNKFKEIVINKLKQGVGQNFWYSKKQIPNLIERVKNSQDYKDIIDVFI